ncbi:MAG: IS200/IS605 family transposase [Pirellulales bacterium]
MPQSLARIAVHIVFSTKNRQRYLTGDDLRIRMHRELGTISNKLDCPPVRIGGVEDHVHILAYQSRTIALAEWVKELKRVSSMWIKEQSPHQAAFQWQAGYGAFSVSHSQTPDVVHYIDNQVEHHRKFDYKTELLTMLRLHEIEYDEQYLWD